MKKKRIFVIFGPKANSDINEWKKYAGKNCSFHQLDTNDPKELMKQALYIIEPSNLREYANMILIYGGGDFRLLPSNLRCFSLNYDLLFSKLKEASGVKRDPGQKEIFCTLFAGALTSVFNMPSKKT